jgi:hypothetical protein
MPNDLLEELRALDQERADERSNDRPPTADSRPSSAKFNPTIGWPNIRANC